MDDVDDDVVGGAGSAGRGLANRLSVDSNCRVLLLEAGPPDRKTEVRVPAAWPKLFRSEVDWALETDPEAELGGRRGFSPRGGTLGGSSSINAMTYAPAQRAPYPDEELT